jgi:cyclohexa-1,5-dienecarbonyl-CoA hydratase
VSETVHTRIEGRAAWLTLDRPPLNILDIAMMRELDAAIERALPRCDFLVLQGAGPKSFSAGAEIADHVPERVGEMLAAFHAIFRRLARADCVTIAGVHGVCLGGGMELATFCDFVVAAADAKFGQPEIKLGCFPPIALLTLPELCGMRAAMDLILTGRTVEAREAERLGLVSRIAAEGQLAPAVAALLQELHVLSPGVLRLTRRTLWRLHAGEFERRLEEVERIYLNELMQTKDAREGIRAFLEKRPAVWQNR